MYLTISRIGNNATVKFAAQELERLLRRMDPTLFIDVRLVANRDTARNDIIYVGIDGSCEENKHDDRIFIDVKNGAGIITGSNPRSVLMAVYRFMFELGCRFLRPGKDGEIIPEKSISAENVNVMVDEAASYRHRSICIEGGNAYEHIRNMIEWLPKVGLNGYFMQFRIPSSFFNRYYNEDNPHLPRHRVNDDDIAAMWTSLEEEISLRGLNYHATGHGWTCDPFGITATDWSIYRGEIPKEAYKAFAEVNGVRQLWNQSALVTNLCYSNPWVRDTMTDAVVEYCKEHPAVNYLHFWLGDGKNNHCECDECKKMIPSDYYVQMLNELDEKLTAAGIDVKVVCLIYLELLWAPEKLTIKNRDRFVLMFAPITRSYTTSFTDFDRSVKIELAPYVRNKIEMPSSVAANVACLKKWQTEQLPGDSFDFDYHLMWAHYADPGYYEISRILHSDMANLDKIGLNGMVSCQANRAAFPNGLPMYAMAKGLWNKDSAFEDIADEYFTAAFGEDAEAVENYMKTLSKLFVPAFMRGEKPCTKAQMAESVRAGLRTVDEFSAKYIKLKLTASEDWRHLDYHAEIVRRYADYILAGLRGDESEREALWKDLIAYQKMLEPEIHEYFDVRTFGTRKNQFTNSLSAGDLELDPTV